MFLSLRSTLSEAAHLWPFGVTLLCILVGGWLAFGLLVPGRRRAGKTNADVGAEAR